MTSLTSQTLVATSCIAQAAATAMVVQPMSEPAQARTPTSKPLAAIAGLSRQPSAAARAALLDPNDGVETARSWHRTWNRPDAAKWGDLYAELVPNYRAVAESDKRAQEAAEDRRT